MGRARHGIDDRLALHCEELAVLLRQTDTKANYRRLLCLWLRLMFSFSASQIGLAVGLRPGTVRRIHSEFYRYGITKILGPGRGGPHHRCLDEQDEFALIAKYRRRTRTGAALNVKALHAELERRVGRRVCLSTTYRMLARHGCRRLLPQARRKRD